MEPKSKNLGVGLTVLGALVLLSAMIILFAGVPEVFEGGYSICIDFPNARGLKTGDIVTLSGLKVGKVTKLGFVDTGKVRARVHIDRGRQIPSNVVATITSGFGGIGGSSIDLSPRGKISPGQPQFLAAGAVIQGQPSFDLMAEAGPMLNSFTKLSSNLNSLLTTVEQTSTAPATGPVPKQGGIAGAIIKLNESLDAILAIMGDKENQRNIKETLSRLNGFMADATVTMNSVHDLVLEAEHTARKASDLMSTMDRATSRASQSIEVLTQQFLKDTELAAKSLESLNILLLQAQSKEGSLGKLLNDPNLYNRMVDLVDQMSGLMTQGNELLRQWKDKGVQLHLR